MEQYLVQLFSVVINIVLLYAFNKYSERQKHSYNKQVAIENGLCSLLRDRLIHCCLYHIKQGSITVEDLDNITSLYKAYKDLQGNGAVESMYKQLLSLPVVTLHTQV